MLQLSSYSSILNIRPKHVKCMGEALKKVFWPLVANFQRCTESKKIEIGKYCSYSKVIETKVVALELFINLEHKAKACTMHGRGARKGFLTVRREFPTRCTKSKKIEIGKYCSYSKVMETRVVALELFINFEHKARACKIHRRGAREGFLTVSHEFPTLH